jgi:hypothetical protein
VNNFASLRTLFFYREWPAGGIKMANGSWEEALGITSPYTRSKNSNVFQKLKKKKRLGVYVVQLSDKT